MTDKIKSCGLVWCLCKFQALVKGGREDKTMWLRWGCLKHIICYHKHQFLSRDIWEVKITQTIITVIVDLQSDLMVVSRSTLTTSSLWGCLARNYYLSIIQNVEWVHPNPTSKVVTLGLMLSPVHFESHRSSTILCWSTSQIYVQYIGGILFLNFIHTHTHTHTRTFYAESNQPCNMKNRDIYWRRYKKHCT